MAHLLRHVILSHAGNSVCELEAIAKGALRKSDIGQFTLVNGATRCDTGTEWVSAPEFA